MQNINKLPRSYKLYRLQKKVIPYLFLLPNILIFLTFIVVPAIMGVVYSFADYDGLSSFKFVGLDNYKEILSSREYWNIFFNTVSYVAIVVPLLFITSLGLAILLLQEIKAKGIFRAIFYWPTMISFIIVGVTWKWIFGDSFGVINYLLGSFGLPTIPWLTDPLFANITIIMATVWARIGFYMVIFMAGLQSIPETYYEAAKIDGASRLRSFWSITLPVLRPTSFLVFMLALIEAFKAFPLIVSLTGGGPGKETTYMVQYIYEYAFVKGQLGYASAMSFILFAIIALFTIVQFRLSKGGRME